MATSLLAQTPRFAEGVYPLLTKAGCQECHHSNGVASTTRLILPDRSASGEEIEQFGDSLRKLVDRADPDGSILFTKPTMRMAHAGGERIKKGSSEETAWRKWVEHLATSAPLAPARTVRARHEQNPALRRLTHSQYDNTVRDLTGDATFPSKQFPPEDFIDGFKNQYQGQSISPLLAESYAAAAEKIAANAKVKDTGASFPADFGRRAFRRPLTPEESKRYGVLYAKGGARLVIEGMLQSPAFLFWLESTPKPELKAYARASRLSYLLWDTMPDDVLYRAAAGGELNTPQGFERQARRLLTDPRARQAVDEFIAQWMRFDRVISMVKERRAYPNFTRELALAMTEETRRLAADLIWNQRNFMDLYTADHTFLNADLAGLYGLPVPAEEFSKVKYPETSGRGGILSHGSFLALTAKPAETSITARGLFIRESFLCQVVPQPPPGVNTNLPAQAEAKPRTNRELLEAHLENPACASCHKLIDPIGYGLERFDGVGGYREQMRVEIPTFNRRLNAKSVTLPINSQGWVTGIEKSEFGTPRELGKILADSPQCQECVVKQFFRYAMGRHEEPGDRAVIGRAAADFRASGYRFQEMMVSLVKWSEFPPKE
jgi:hypothetical protein